LGRWKLNGKEVEETGYWGVRKLKRPEIGKRRRQMKGSEERSESQRLAKRGLKRSEIGK